MRPQASEEGEYPFVTVLGPREGLTGSLSPDTRTALWMGNEWANSGPPQFPHPWSGPELSNPLPWACPASCAPEELPELSPAAPWGRVGSIIPILQMDQPRLSGAGLLGFPSHFGSFQLGGFGGGGAGAGGGLPTGASRTGQHSSQGLWDAADRLGLAGGYYDQLLCDCHLL